MVNATFEVSTSLCPFVIYLIYAIPEFSMVFRILSPRDNHMKEASQVSLGPKPMEDIRTAHWLF